MALKLSKVCYRYPESAPQQSRAGDLATPSPFTLRCDSLEIEPATMVCVTGANGSGKSTLSRLLCGILTPQAGAVLIDGDDLTGAPLAAFGRRVGYVFQEPAHQLFATTVIEELTCIGQLTTARREHPCLQQRAEALLRRFNLSDLRERSPQRLSHGEQQRLALAAVLMQEPRYLVLDEPSSGLDAASVEFLCQLLNELCQQGAGCCVITHDPRLRPLCGREVTTVAGEVCCSTPTAACPDKARP
ncbi:MAG: energy-coupling factor ABC transporter ATP-binding protein [Coriobacteriia bacterium]|nr:energy-coupling factor ABC transporter ATP-binding protein [Coriobacteriia bacterium]